jgi:hypothetical protein
MDTNDVPADNAEQQWIAKYRRALGAAAIPVQHSRGMNLWEAVARAYRLAASNVGKILEQWIHPKPLRAIATVKVDATRFQQFPAPPER